MRKNLSLGAIAVISAVALAGVGFAAYTATATVTVNANAGSFYLVNTAALRTSSLTSASASCTASAPGSSVSLTLDNLLPGDFCNYTVTTTDPGTVGGSAPYGVVGACSGGCSQISIYAAWLSPYGALAPLSGSSDTFYVLVTDTGSGAVAESDVIPLTITASPA